MPEDIEKLKEENQKLQKLSDFKSDVISISAHELRTSLSALKWILKMFIDGDIGAISTEQKTFIKKAFESNERMISLVNEMLSVNHADDISLKYNPEEVDIVNLVESVLFDFVGESFKKNIQVIFLKGEAKLPKAFVDPYKARVVLQNLVDNAIKYSNFGSKIFVSIELKNKNIQIAVKDNGIGIPEKDQPKIFEKFFRSENAKQKSEIGSGLGLTTARNIVARWEGKIWFESKENGGSNFYFTLPTKN